ncbi:MAG: hypothetical protein FH756_10925 [Firmicutes bacterium]|nr:hypothetical protein [Bacillota bacterium]
MICIFGSEILLDTLNDFKISPSLNKAKYAVIEMPGNNEKLQGLQGIPVIVVITDMITAREWDLIKTHDTANLKTIRPKLEELIAQEEPASSEDDLTLDFQPEEVEGPVQPPKQTPERPQNLTPPAIARPQIQKGYIASSFSAAGGVGKTFTSINLAGYMALKSVSSAVIDLDLGYGDVDTATGLMSPEQRDKVIDKKAKVPKNGWATVANWRDYARNLKGSLLQHNSKLYILPSYPFSGDTLPAEEIEDLILAMAENFDFVMIDLGVNAFSAHSKKALELSDTIFIVGGQDEKTLGKFNHFHESHPDTKNMRLSINMVDPKGFYTPKETAKKLGFKDFDEIPLDTMGVNAAKKAKKLAVQFKECTAGEAVKKIAAKHLPFEIEYENQEKSTSFFSGLKSIFGR